MGSANKMGIITDFLKNVGGDSEKKEGTIKNVELKLKCLYCGTQFDNLQQYCPYCLEAMNKIVFFKPPRSIITPETNKLCMDGIFVFRSGRHDLALELFNKVLLKSPDHPVAQAYKNLALNEIVNHKKKIDEQTKKREGSDELQEKKPRRPHLVDKNVDGQNKIDEAWKNIDNLQDSGILIYIDKFVEKYPDVNEGVNFEILRELLTSKQFYFYPEELKNIISVRKVALVYNEMKEMVLSNNPVNSDECLRNFIKKYINTNVFSNIELTLMVYQVLSDQFEYEGDINKDIERIRPEIMQEMRKNELKKFESDLIGETSTSYDQITIRHIDIISGYDFELVLKKLFEKMGYQVIHTSFSHDQGADLILEKDGMRCVVQAKNVTANVGNSGVQAVVAAIKHYNAHKSIVISSSGFTASAIELARSNNVELWDRIRLSAILEDNPIYPDADR